MSSIIQVASPSTPTQAPFVVDLRSDTVTSPTPAMRRAMAQAEVGDDVFGEDPTVNALEARGAALFGREAALFVPSGTMANQIAIRLHARPGDEALCGWSAHSYLYETGGAAALSGVQLTPLGRTGLFTAAEVQHELKPENIHFSPIKLVMVENTHNRGGGLIFPLEELQKLSALRASGGFALHMDGARVFNACVATGHSPAVYGGLVNTLSCCLSKGLGAPVGSLLVGDEADMHLARRYRKLFGGGMRQVGILAAAGLFALEQHVERLADDHARAQTLAKGLAQLRGITLDPEPETNIVFFRMEHPDWEVGAFIQALHARGVRLISLGPNRLRAVLHLDVDDLKLEYALSVFRALLGEA